MVSAPSLQRPLTRSLRVYQRIALGFVGLTFLMLFVVMYLSVSRATITVIAKPSTVTTTAALEVVKNPASEGQIAGAVAQEIFTKEQTFTLPQEGARAVEQKATGKVTIKNTTNSVQPLIATTRLLTPGGILFRLTEGVTVPAQGEVSAAVAADVAGVSGDIAPSTFIIPGLAQSLQDKIYAISTESMVGGVQYVRTLSESDIADAKVALNQAILDEAAQKLSAGLSADLAAKGTYDVEEIQGTASVPVGTETGVFTYTLQAKVTGVFYDKDLVTSYAKSLLQKRIPEGFLLYTTNEQGVQTTIESANYTTGEAQLSVYLDGTAIISADAPTLAKERFLGRSPSEVFTLLRASDAIADVSLAFTPFWLQRIPTLKDHIEIVIEPGKGE